NLLVHQVARAARTERPAALSLSAGSNQLGFKPTQDYPPLFWRSRHVPRTLPSRALHRFLAVLLICGFSLPAAAQFSRDASASSKIDEAINTHYLMMELDKAEEMLKGVVEACEMKCSPGVKAKAWMYVGIVRGSGKNDLAGAT